MLAVGPHTIHINLQVVHHYVIQKFPDVLQHGGNPLVVIQGVRRPLVFQRMLRLLPLLPRIDFYVRQRQHVELTVARSVIFTVSVVNFSSLKIMNSTLSFVLWNLFLDFG